MTCAGNRRVEFNKIKPVGGVQWGAGAIGNAQWGGARLSEVLKAAGLKADAKHIWFEGMDEVPHGQETIGFGGSIPLTKALADTAAMPRALLSYEMNGEPLTPDHGFPLRSVVPGYIGARSVKWLGRIVVSDRPSPNHYVAGAYKLVTEDTPLAWDEAGVIYNYAVNSVIAGVTVESQGSSRAGKVTDLKMQIMGYALPNGDGGQRPGPVVEPGGAVGGARRGALDDGV
jgi:sulfite oxidase